MTKSISILGSTGSIGRQTIDVAMRKEIEVLALTTNTNIDLLEEQARALTPRFVSANNKDAAATLRDRLSDTNITVGSGMEGLLSAATIDDAETVVTAVSGSVGLRPTIAAVQLGRRIALANKETLVCAGTVVMGQAAECGAELIPVDSEHSAIFQCLQSGEKSELSKILLTASGGPFRGQRWNDLADKTPQQALKHPNWSMGSKISIDSATMINKGLEFIEAMYLFAVKPEQIEIHIHPESVVHSMVEFIDGSVIAQLGINDMRLPIQYALSYPERLPSSLPCLDLFTSGMLTFEKPDFNELPCLRAAIECARVQGTAPAIMNAANEVAVELFLRREISYTQIYDCIASALDSIEIKSDAALELILNADEAARSHVLGQFRS